ncbi:MAG: hypothetical protein HY579_11160 [Nitrospinae bacterium]|nr:hypothetical protein [Nitrospinota bacterium]
MNSHAGKTELSISRRTRPTRLFRTISFALFLALTAGEAAGAEIVLQLSGNAEFPGWMALRAEAEAIDRICFLGKNARGNIDGNFLDALSRSGIPEGEYAISGPLEDERWPSRTFQKNGVLRLKAASGETIAHLDRMRVLGLAIHGRDFYPLLENRVKDPKMIAFYNDDLFERLRTHWGPLRISNWDMGRLFDFWARFSGPSQWKVRVQSGSAEETVKKCKPATAQRPAD